MPHQISAVYEEMLPRQPMRFLLADEDELAEKFGLNFEILAGDMIQAARTAALLCCAMATEARHR